MVYSLIVDVPTPIDVYDAVHAEAIRHDPGGIEGLLLHLGRATPEGFQVLEVWESKDDYLRNNREVIAPIVERLSAGQATEAPDPSVTEIDLHGLVIPRGPIVI